MALLHHLIVSGIAQICLTLLSLKTQLALPPASGCPLPGMHGSILLHFLQVSSQMLPTPKNHLQPKIDETLPIATQPNFIFLHTI